MLAKLGLLDGVPACTDLTTKPWVQEAGVEVLDQPFFAKGNLATAGGCLSSAYLAAWMITRLDGVEAATSALHYVAPVGEKEDVRRTCDAQHHTVFARRAGDHLIQGGAGLGFCPVSDGCGRSSRAVIAIGTRTAHSRSATGQDGMGQPHR